MSLPFSWRTLAACSAFASVLAVPPSAAAQGHLPAGFGYVANAIPTVIEAIRYYGTDNFIGVPIRGYEAPRCILSLPAIQALARVQQRLEPFGLGLKLFDCYRPQRAVDHFLEWSKDPHDQRHKATYYPEVAKDRLFTEGYIAERSGHSRGSTVDLTLVDSASAAELDMGTVFDYFGPASWPESPAVATQARANRLLLQMLMRDAGFLPLAEEWWHFTLANEPFPDTYFDFTVR